MRFSFDNVSYLIDFERTSKVPTGAYEGGKPSTRARIYTTAKIYKITGPGKEDREVVRSYTVGHNPHDRFTYEGGRKVALTMAMYDAPTKGGGEPLLGQKLTKDFRTAAWVAYHGRFEK